MPLTNADYLAIPQPPESLGASPERARRLARVVAQRRIGKMILKPAMLIAVGIAVWVFYALMLAFNGSLQTPTHEQMLWPSIGALFVGIVIAIARASSMTTGPWWEPNREIPRELVSAPRRAIVPRMNLGGLMAGIGFSLLIAIAGLLVDDVRDASLLQKNGVETTGTVISRRIRSGKSKDYFVTYRYGSSEVRFQNTARVSRSEYERMTEGSTVPVTYDATHPMISQPRARGDIRDPLRAIAPLIGIAVGLTLVAMLMSLLMAYAQRQTEALVTRGVVALGRATSVHRQAAVTLEYASIEKRVRWGKQRPAPMPVVGETYLVFYDPDDPRRSMPLAMLQDVRFV